MKMILILYPIPFYGKKKKLLSISLICLVINKLKFPYLLLKVENKEGLIYCLNSYICHSISTIKGVVPFREILFSVRLLLAAIWPCM